MCLHVLFEAVFILTVFSPCLGINRMTKNFSRCDLPLEISINRTHDYEISDNNDTSFVTIGGSTYTVNFPFKNRGNQTVTLHECMDFDLKIFYNENNNEQEEHIHYKCKPCNRTTDPPTDPPTNHIGLVIAIVVLVFVLVLALVAVIVYRKLKAMIEKRFKAVKQDDNDDSSSTAHDRTSVDEIVLNDLTNY